MSDIWSNLGTDIQANTGSGWLYHHGGEVHGPIPLERLIEKLAAGDINLKTPVAKEGGDFHPAGQVAAIEPHLDRVRSGIRKRSASKLRKVLLILAIPALGIAAGAAFMTKAAMDQKEQERIDQAKALEEQRKKDEEKLNKLLASGQPKLVGLISLEDINVGGSKPSRRPTRPRPGNKPNRKEPEDNSFTSSCQRSQQQIFGVLTKHLRTLNVCVQDEKSRNPSGLPSTLPLEFVVTPTGKVTGFEIQNRHYRTGPMNNCMLKVFRRVKFPSAGGSNCPVTIPIRI